MLMMTTIFMSVMAELPSTAYVKHIDIWLIGCQLVPFLEVLLLISIEALREEKDDAEEEAEADTAVDCSAIIDCRGCEAPPLQSRWPRQASQP